MKSIKPTTPRAFVIFCDDIREETSGKTTYVGVYGGGLYSKRPLPVNLSKFCISLQYYERPGESEAPLKVHVYLPGDEDGKPSIEANVPDEMREMKPPNDPDADDPFIGGTMNIEISPLRISQKGRIKVRVIRGDDEIRAGSLFVSSLAEAEPAAESSAATDQEA